MTATKTDTPWCAEHRRPLPDCRPDVKHVHPMRFRTDMWAGAERVALAAGTDRTALVRRLLEVALGYIRCEKCDYRSPDGPGIPVEFGDLTGFPLGEWIARAAEQVARQHPDHEPVIIGGQSGTRPEAPRKRKPVSPVAADGDKAATIGHLRGKIKEAETRPAAAKVVRFQPPPADTLAP